MNNLSITFIAFLLLFIFISGGVNKIMNFQGTVDLLKTKINTIHAFLGFLNFKLERNSRNNTTNVTNAINTINTISGLVFQFYAQ